MKKFLPTLCGMMAGAILAVYLLFQPEEAIPPFFRFKVEHISGVLHKFLLPASDPSMFLAPVCILFCTILGALIGFGIGTLLKMMRRHRDTP